MGWASIYPRYTLDVMYESLVASLLDSSGYECVIVHYVDAFFASKDDSARPALDSGASKICLHNAVHPFV